MMVARSMGHPLATGPAQGPGTAQEARLAVAVDVNDADERMRLWRGVSKMRGVERLWQVAPAFPRPLRRLR